uniref:CAP-Gly domain-containing protein n=1 Tax=Myotis lucifugus TaxID=59463 RepID=G1Q2N8_MYOLU
QRLKRRFQALEFTCKVELVVGKPSFMELEMYGAEEKFYSKLDQEDALLSSDPVDDSCHIHVIDHGGACLGEYEDVSKVEKYRISKEAYEHRQEPLRSFLKCSKLGRYNEKEQAQQETEITEHLREEKAHDSVIRVDSCCEVQGLGQPPRWGVMYVGLTDFKPGYWIGVHYDEPLEKKDGSVNRK